MKTTLRENISQHRLLLDGAMGSLIQQYSLSEEDFRGNDFANWDVPLKGNNDILVLTQPDVIADIHRRYLMAGADIITTCTFSAQRVSQQEYHTEEFVEEINRQAAKIARREADDMSEKTPSRPRFVLGDVGPTSRMLSMSEDVSNPAARTITFDEMKAAFLQQMIPLMQEGVDGILLETMFDTLNVKAAISAFDEAKAKTSSTAELLISLTISDASGRLLSGQTIEAFVASTLHAHPLSYGINCGFGTEKMIPFLRQLNDAVGGRAFITCHPNAGMPNTLGEYDHTPEMMMTMMKPIITDELANIIGGCCGTTPEHIAAMRSMIDSPLSHGRQHTTTCDSKYAKQEGLTLTGLERFRYSHNDFIIVGERCNVAGSRKFLRLINEKKYDEALDIARTQVERGAMVIDVNMDDGLLNAREEMRTFINLIASDPAVCRVPLMIDSSRFDVIEEGLKCCQGKCIVNSISLKQGEKIFLEQARKIKQLGAAVIVMCFDEEGQATDYERRIAICDRAYHLLIDKVGFPPEDIIFDPNVLTVATGMAEHADYARDFIRATQWITDNLPGARVSGGLSNLSFAFRGNNYLREAMHSVFLHHAIKAGMGMAIMNPQTAVKYEDIPTDLREAITAVILNTDEHATERLTEMAQALLEKQQAMKSKVPAATTTGKAEGSHSDNVHERLKQALIKGTGTTLQEDILHLINNIKETPLDIISGPLMSGMNEVGRLFGEGKMFLPQVVKTARTMKQAVDILQPYMQTGSDNGIEIPSAGRIVIATVKGDVHDIGKNIVAVVLACNGFKVIDLGVMVPAETIVQQAIEQKADIVCLSGLITPSLEEMCNVARAMQSAGLEIPLFVGGATTSLTHTATKIAELYRGGVFHLRDAAQDPVLALKLLDPKKRDEVMERNNYDQQRIRIVQRQKAVMREAQIRRQGLEPEAAAYEQRYQCDWHSYTPVPAPFFGERRHQDFHVSQLIPKIDWLYFFWAWKVKEDSEDGRLLRNDADRLLQELSSHKDYCVHATSAFYPAIGEAGGIRIQSPEEVNIITPRQKLMTANGKRRELCLAMSDFVSPLGGDHIGAFAATVSKTFCDKLEQLKAEGSDDYQAILLQTLGDRLAEAAAQILAEELATDGWHGIRPAIGYPSLPNQREIFKVAQLLDFKALGITITENGAMYPQASVAGLYISHPEARYFEV